MKKAVVWMAMLGVSMASAVLQIRDPPVVIETQTSSYIAPATTVYAGPCAVVATTMPSPKQTPYNLISLGPSVPSGIDLTNLDNLVPHSSADLYYSNGASTDSDHDFALVNAKLVYPAVVLDHTSFVSNIACESSGMILSFTNSDAFKTAQASWNGTYLIITSAQGCQDLNNPNIRGFFLVTSTTFQLDSLSVVLNALVVGIEQALADIDIDFGSFTSATSTTGFFSPAASATGFFSPVASATGSLSPDASTTEQFPPTSSTTDTDILPTPVASNSTCGEPPAATISGFPAAPCGETFDNLLDAAIGFFDFDLEDFSASLQSAAPGLDDFSVDDYQEDDILQEDGTTLSRRQAKRASKVKPAPKPIPKPIPKPVAPIVAPKPSAVAQKVAAEVKKTNTNTPVKGKVAAKEPAGIAPKEPSKLAAKLADAGAALATTAITVMTSDPEVRDTLAFSLPPASASFPTVTSPFGTAYELFSQGASGAYCVGCGAAGTLTFAGKLSLGIISGPLLKTANINVNGAIQATVALGLKAEGTIKQKGTKSLGSFKSKGYEVDKIIKLEPEVSISAVYDLDIEGSGTVIANASASIPDYGVTVDFADFKKSKLGDFKPSFTPKFEASGQLTANTISLSLPMKFGIGITLIGLGGVKVNAAVVNTPSLLGSVKYSPDTNPPTGCNNGIEYSASFFDASNIELLNQAAIPLSTFTASSIGPTCKFLGGTPTTSVPGPTTTSSETTPTTSDTITTDIMTPSATLAPTLEPTFEPIPTPATTLTTSQTTPTPAMKRYIPVGRYNRRQDTLSSSDDSATSVFVPDAQETGTATDSDATVDSDENQVDDEGNDNSFDFGPIYEASGKYILANDDFGNFNIRAAGEESIVFASYENITMSDAADRLMYYYPDTMTAFGVSRFRMNFFEDIPKTADFITLTPINDDGLSTTPGTYVAVDTSQNVFFTVVCFFESQPAKLFLVNDIETGTEKLLSPDLRYILTGGVVTFCSAIELNSAGAGI